MVNQLMLPAMTSAMPKAMVTGDPQAGPSPTIKSSTAMTPTQSPYAVARQPKQNGLLEAGVDGFMRGFRPKQWQEDKDRAKADAMERGQQTLALMQQQRALPEDQRTDWWVQNADQIGEILGTDVKAMPLDPSGFTDQALDGTIATLSAKLGIAPAQPKPMTAYEQAQIDLKREEQGQPTPFNLGDGAFAEYTQGKGLSIIREPNPKQPTMDKFQAADGTWYYVNPQTLEKTPVGVQGRVPGEGGGASRDTYRPATPEDRTYWNLPSDGAFMVNEQTGEPKAVTGARAASEYTPTQQNKFIQQAGVLDSMEGALNAYRNLVKSVGPQVWTTGLGGDNANAKKLDAARTAVLIQAKELFNLGVLNGPDLDIIGAAVPDVTGWDANGKSFESVNSQLSVLGDYIKRGRNQIPPEFVDKARPNAPKNTQRPDINNPAMQMGIRAYAKQSGIPQDAITEFLSNDPTPQEVAEFNGIFGEGKAEAILKAMSSAQ